MKIQLNKFKIYVKKKDLKMLKSKIINKWVLLLII